MKIHLDLLDIVKFNDYACQLCGQCNLWKSVLSRLWRFVLRVKMAVTLSFLLNRAKIAETARPINRVSVYSGRQNEKIHINSFPAARTSIILLYLTPDVFTRQIQSSRREIAKAWITTSVRIFFGEFARVIGLQACMEDVLPLLANNK